VATQERRPHDDRWPSDDATTTDDDLDRAFGSGDGVARPSHRVRRAVLMLVGVLCAVALIAAALLYIVSGVQSGIGGVFPKPEQARQSFTAQSESLPGVTAVRDGAVTRTGFASYDVTTSVLVDQGVTGSARQDLVAALASQAADVSRSGVHLYAMVEFGDGIELGLSPDPAIDADRLELATAIRGVAGVTGVRSAWAPSSGSIDDQRDSQHVTITVANAADVAGVTATARPVVERAFPGAHLEVAVPKG
jgi:hypothetical protein